MEKEKRLNKDNVENIVTLTSMQQGMLFQYLLDPKSDMYFEQLSVHLTGEVEHRAFVKAWQCVVDNNEMLRTVFRWEKLEKPVQIVLKEQELVYLQHDLSALNQHEQTQVLEEIKTNDRKQGFDLEYGANFRIHLCDLGDHEYLLLVSNHHILYDGWSTGVILSEFLEAYNTFIDGNKPAAKDKTKFAEYLKWYQTISKTEQADYWTEYLAGFERKTGLPTDHPTQAVIPSVGTHTVRLPAELTAAIDRLVKTEKVTLSSFLTAIWGIVLQKYNNVTDVLFGTTVSGRPVEIPGIETMVGLFINTIPTRVCAGSTMPFTALLADLHHSLQERKMSTLLTPLVDIKTYSEFTESDSLFDSLLVIENYPFDQKLRAVQGQIQINNLATFSMTNYDLTLEVQTFDGIELHFQYKTPLFHVETVQRLASHFLHLIEEVTVEPTVMLGEIQLITSAERTQLLREWNDTNEDFLYKDTILEVFEQKAAEAPERVAVVAAKESLTYGELNARANQLARALRNQGVGPNQVVGILAERSVEMLVGIFAVLKAGGAYLPLDVDYPAERIEFILQDAGVQLLLSDHTDINGIHFHGTILDVTDQQNFDPDMSNLECITKPHDLMYILYTSGSTGEPKGVMIEHASVMNIAQALHEKYPFHEGDTYLLKTSVTFDVSVSELFGWFWDHGRLAILEPGGEKDPGQMMKAIKDFAVTHINFVPSMLRVFLDGLSSTDLTVLQQLQYCFVAGEALTSTLVEKFCRLLPTVRLINLYGPTEATIYATAYAIEDRFHHRSIPIGKPISNVRAYIVDKNDHLQPIGAQGELCIAGLGLARGYLHRDELNREKFVDNPFTPDEKMYKTGDLTRWLPDGNIEFLGRIDHQVKIRGFRVELGEIEEQILRIDSVQSAVVLDKADHTGIHYLVAYYVANDPLSADKIKEQLSKKLPAYLIPTHLMQLDAMPLTSSGKLDRKSLPDVTLMSGQSKDVRLPSTDVEVRLAKIWSSVLGMEHMDLGMNFFHLGGHSLNAIQIVTMIQKEFHLTIPLQELFQHPTIEELAKVIEAAQGLEYMDIPPLPETEYYDLSSSQKRMWILDQLEPNSSAYIISHVHTFTEYMDREALEKACEALVDRHESLRTNFITVAGEPKQTIHSKRKFELDFVDLQAQEEAKEMASLEAIRFATRPFDLKNDLLFRATLVQLGESHYQLLLALHHIIADGWSMDIFQQELSLLYEAYKTGRANPLHPLSIQYKDFAAWQNRMIEQGKMESLRDDWMTQLHHPLPILRLPWDAPYHQQDDDRTGAAYQVRVPQEVGYRLERFAQTKGVTLSAILVAAFSAYLSRLTGERDVVFAGPVTGRDHENVKNIIGLFMNTVLFRNQVDWDESFEYLIERVQENLVKILDAQAYPFELLAEELKLNLEQQPNVTSISLNILNFAHSQRTQGEGLRLGHLKLAQQMKFDLGLYLTETDQGILVNCEYRSTLFKRQTIQYLIEEFVHFLREISLDGHKPVKVYDLFSKERVLSHERQIRPINPYLEFTKEEIEQSIPQRFAAIVQHYPEKVAVRSGVQELTYLQLNQQANRLAFAITRQLTIVPGEKKQQKIALLFEHGIDMIVGMLGVLQAGQIYVPLDPTYPVERLSQIILEVQPDVLVTNLKNQELANRLLERLPSNCLLLELENLDDAAWDGTLDSPTPDQIAYILYTSGSTGRPKGVFQSHRNVLHHIRNYTNRLHLSHQDRLTLFSSYCFDASVMDIYGALLNGATLCPYNIKEDGSLSDLAAWLVDEKVSIYHSVPTVFRYFTDSLTGQERFPDLRLLVMGGEALIQRDLQRFKQHFADHTILVNGFGPTESTLALQYFLDKNTELANQAIPVGYPVDETEVLLLDENGHEVPVFSIGEIVIKSPYLALGYWQMPELTDTVFSVDPRTGAERVYWSGDLGQRLADGSICFIGRRDYGGWDNHVKIRGFRVETGEIESELLTHPQILEAVVVAQENEGMEAYLVAYLVGKVELTVPELKDYVSTRLPRYMIPAYFVQLEKMPLNHNVKLERKLLPEVKGQMAVGVTYEPPQDEVEMELAKLFKQVLATEAEIGRYHDFFDLGGHSLKAMILKEKIQERLNVEVTLMNIFKNPSIQSLAKTIKQTNTPRGYTGISPVEKKEYYPLSSAQKRMFILHQLDPESTAYHIPIALKIEGKIDKARLEATFKKIIQRHETLRTSFPVIHGEPVQQIHEQVDFTLSYVEVTESEVDHLIDQFIQPFSLQDASLFRVGLVKLPKYHLLLVDMHHIISDGTSLGILVEEFLKLYNYLTLPALKVQYKDYAAWQLDGFAKGKWKRQEEYWLNRFKGDIPVLELLTDYERPAGKMSMVGGTFTHQLDKSLSDQVYQFARKNDATLYMVLLAAYNLLLYKYTGEEDIVVGSPIAGRSHADLDHLVGMFVNTLAMRNTLQPDQTLLEFLNQVKENSFAAFENQDYQFEELVEKLGISRDLSKNALFSTLFSLQNMDVKEIEIASLKISPYEFENKTSKFDISIKCTEEKEGIQLQVQYKTNLFAVETIKRFTEHYTNILKEMIQHPEVTVARLDILSEKEKVQLVSEFNNTTTDYPRDKVYYQLFAEQVSKTPDALALRYNEKSLTYQELSKQVDHLAAYLHQEWGLGSEDMIGLKLYPSERMFIAILAVLKLGACYLPIDPEFPHNRIKYMIDNARVEHLLIDSDVEVEPMEIHCLNLEEAIEKAASLENVEIQVEYNVHSPALVIYTSGTTGQPKGVVTKNINFVNYSCWFKSIAELGTRDKTILLASYAFDLGYTSISPALISGAELHILRREQYLDSDFLVNYINQNQITIYKSSPSLFGVIANSTAFAKYGTDTLRWVVLGGERLDVDDIMKLHQISPNVRVLNHYGPTETTIGSVTFPIDFEEVQTWKSKTYLGRPIHNMQAYILDHQLNQVPVGVQGQIFMAGEGISRGYLNRPDLDVVKFIEITLCNGERKRGYLTGDLGRFRADGAIEFLGRVDHQVKIRGYRVEISEVENKLKLHPGVRDVAVVGRGDGKEKHLYAYLIPEGQVTNAELKEYLGRDLPEYMIPSYFVQVEEFPLTRNGKLDFKALAQIEIQPEEVKDYTPPANQLEEALVGIWSTVLGLDRQSISVTGNFFELGGHSLRAIVLISKIHEELDVKISLEEIFRLPTIRQQAERVQDAVRESYLAIQPVEYQEYYPLTSSQEWLLILNEIEPHPTRYNITTALQIEGEIDEERIEATFKQLIQRHEALRTGFEIVEGVPVQRIYPDCEFQVTRIVGDEDIDQAIDSFTIPFDLKKPPLFRVGLKKITDTTAFIIVDIHHIIIDGTSLGVMGRDFVRLYRNEPLPALRIQPRDFSVWQRTPIAQQLQKKQEEFWVNKFQGELPVLNLPTDYPRPVVQSFDMDLIHVIIDRKILDQINRLSAETNTTLYMILLAALNTLLYRYTSQSDIVVGTVAAGRDHTDLHRMVGVFINMLPMRNAPAGMKRFIDFLEEVKINTVQAYENQTYPFHQLMEKVYTKKDLSRSGLFDVMLMVQNMEFADVTLPGTRVDSYAFPRRIANVDITLQATALDEGLQINLEYCTKLFKRETMERFTRHLENILSEAMNQPEIQLKDIEFMDESEKELLLERFNQNRMDLSDAQTIYQHVERHASLTPDRRALRCGKEEWTYGQLNAKANQLARVLKRSGIGTDQLVGILLERSPLMVASILAVWKSGGAYIPLDPEYPVRRIGEILQDSGTLVLLTDSKYLHDELRTGFTGHIIELDQAVQEIDQEDSSNLAECLDMNSLAYVIYTSGSTGKPKGAMVEHIGMMNHIQAKIHDLQLTEDSIVAQNASHCFDISVWQFFVGLTVGGETVIYPQEVILNPKRFIEEIEADQVTILEVVPSYLAAMLDKLDPAETQFNCLNDLLVTGEAVKPGLVKSWFANYPGIKMVNAYGPTEASDDITHFIMDHVPDLERIPIGKPVQNFNIYIVDEYMHLCPVGVVGEICVSGLGVGRGYLNNAEKTAEVFMEDPFSVEKGRRLYKTGDLGRWLADGTIDFLGRKDYQVKIRGFRIEMGEIENRLLEHPEVKEAVIVDRTDSYGNKYLLAYLVAGEALDVSQLREYLLNVLPYYMVPEHFVTLEQMPLNANGKIDRKALPEPELGLESPEKEYVAPRNEIEERLARIWQDVLRMERIGVTDNFFDLGGHSLKAIVITGQIFKEFKTELSLKVLFEHPTIQEVAALIQSEKESEFTTITPVEKREYYQLSSAQKRLYLIYQLNPKSVAYNLPVRVILEGNIDRERLLHAFKQLIARHESLRTSFVIVHDTPMQRIHETVDFAVEYHQANAEEVAPLIEEFIRPFDLEQAPLLRAELIQIEAAKHVLVFDIHHIVSDGISGTIFVKEFVALYNGVELPELRIQYKDFSEWQNQLFLSDKIKKQEEYWLNRFKGDLTTLQMPLDYPRPSILEYTGATVYRELDTETTQRVYQLVKEMDSTLYIVLLAVYNILLAKYTGQEDLIIGSPTTGRTHADVQNIIGMFVNMLVMRNQAAGSKTVREFMAEVKANSLDAYENQDYQFEELVQKLDLQRDVSRNPLFDVAFSLHNLDMEEIEVEGLKVLPYPYESTINNFDLVLIVKDGQTSILLEWKYLISLFKRTTIEKLHEHYLEILKVILDSVDQKISEIHLSHDLVAIPTQSIAEVDEDDFNF